MQKLPALTVFILATNEKKLLRQTILSVVEACGKENLYEIVAVLPTDDCPAALVCKEFGASVNGVSFHPYIQKNKDQIRFFAEIPFLAKSSHFVIMVGDMEMNPGALREMLAISKEKPDAIICSAKWVKGSRISGYGFFHRIANISVNRAAAILLRNRYRDLFSVFEIYPKAVFDKMHFDNMSTLLFEYTLKPVSKGIDYIEIPTVFQKRTEGISNSSIRLYIKLGIGFILAAIRISLRFHIDTDVCSNCIEYDLNKEQKSQ